MKLTIGPPDGLVVADYGNLQLTDYLDLLAFGYYQRQASTVLPGGFLLPAGRTRFNAGSDLTATQGREVATGFADGLVLIVSLATGVPEAAAAAGTIRGGAQLLYRYRNGFETATRLGNQAARAQEAIGIYGVSVTTSPIAGRACGVACREAVEEVFKVIKTGRDPNHYTVELPNPVTKEVARIFNNLFKDVP